MRLYLIRHGQTEWNAEYRLHGWLDSPLTPEAVSLLEQTELPQSDKLVIFSSDLGRAVHSASIIAQKSGEEVVQDNRLRERNYGALQGEVIDEDESLKPVWQRYHQRYLQKLGGDFDIESESSFERRIVSFLSDLSSLDDSTNVVIIGHGEWLRAATNIIQGVPSWYYGDGIAANGSLVILNWTPTTLTNHDLAE